MHFITGGAFNGKRVWVIKHYEAEGKIFWLSAYKGEPIPQEINDNGNDIVILEGIEIWIKKLIDQNDAIETLKVWNQWLEDWMQWEAAKKNRKLVVIGTDISKGIVPMERENRLWRDTTGWVYQKIASKAEKVDIIWYGLNQTIKEKGMEPNETVY